MSKDFNCRIAVIEYSMEKPHPQVVNQVMGTLQKSFHADLTYVKENRKLSCLQGSSPLLVIVIQSDCIEKFSQFCLGTIKGIAPRASIMGVICQKVDRKYEALLNPFSHLDDYLLYPFEEVDLVFRVRRVMRSKAQPPEQSFSFGQGKGDSVATVVGESSNFRRCLEKIPIYADSDETVLITGETGTGKDLIARLIHQKSRRYDKPFVPVNCGALPDHLCENELFGHAKGAFTDASTSEKGLIAEAEGGTLFLDEIGTLSASAQTRLLRFLQDREYRPLGSSKRLIANVRVVAATNSCLKSMVTAKDFREDLYHRLGILTVALPPLRDRLEDVPGLAAHFLKKHSKTTASGLAVLSPEALQKLLAYRWPGNIRELEAVMCRTAILNRVALVTPDQIEIETEQSITEKQSCSLSEAKKQFLNQFEKSYLVTLMHSHKGNVSHAANAAGKQRRSFQRLLQKYGIQRQSFLR